MAHIAADRSGGVSGRQTRGRRPTTRHPWYLHGLVLLATLSLPAQLGAAFQPADDSAGAEPLQCWWRSSTPAVRAGEAFTVVLTCACSDLDSQRVVLDETKLAPESVPLAPFEVLSGAAASDLRVDDRRFLQREYKVRLVNDSFFGKDVALPALALSYRVQSQGNDGTPLTGIERKYELPPQPIRVQSLVAADATDIRDTSAGTFADLDRAAFRASSLVTGGGILVGLGGVLAVLALGSAVAGVRRTRPESSRLVADSAVLSQVARELAAVRRDRDQGAWTPELAGRALAALRVAGAYTAAANTSQRDAEPEDALSEGAFLHTSLAGKRVVVSSALTARSVRTARARATTAGAASKLNALDSLDDALTPLTQARYGRSGTVSDAALDDALAAAERLTRSARYTNRWAVRKLNAARARASSLSRRVWRR